MVVTDSFTQMDQLTWSPRYAVARVRTSPRVSGVWESEPDGGNVDEMTQASRIGNPGREEGVDAMLARLAESDDEAGYTQRNLPPDPTP